MAHIGKYDKRVTIEKIVDSPTTDDLGTVDLTDPSNWETYIQRWAQVHAIAGDEGEGVGLQVRATVDYTIKMYSDSETRAITPQMRVSYNSRIINITSVIDKKEMREEVVIKGTELV